MSPSMEVFRLSLVNTIITHIGVFFACERAWKELQAVGASLVSTNLLQSLSSPTGNSMPSSFPESSYLSLEQYNAVPSYSNFGADRVILQYSMGRCGPTTSTDNASTILSGQQTTSSALGILRDRVSQYLHDKKQKHIEAVDSVPLTTSHSLAVDLPSRFLSALHMEVITAMPHGVAPDDVVRLSDGIPCIEKAYRDSAKMIDDGFLNQRPTLNDPDGPGGNVERKVLDRLDRGESPPARLSGEQVPPNDPYFKNQWSLRGDSQYGINAEMAWKVWNGHGRPMIIAVIDSGCDIDHPDLVGNIWENPGEICGDGVDNDLNGLIDDCHGWDFTRDSPAVEPEKGGHGTSSAGVTAASANNLMATAGVCWGCKVMCLKFFGAEEGLVSNQLQALNYALRNGAWISNNSYGGYGWSELEYEGIRRAQAAGHLFVASAGNHDVETDTAKHFHTPSAYPLSNIISVGASTHKGRKAEFSNYGRSSVHIFAPGTDILATGNGNGIVKVSGTSFASPHVAGAAGLVWSAFPNLTYAQVKMALLDSCRKVSFLRDKASCGGIVDAYKALRVAARISEGIYAPHEGLNFLRQNSRLSPGPPTENDPFAPFSVLTSDEHKSSRPDQPVFAAEVRPSESMFDRDPLLIVDADGHQTVQASFHKKEAERKLLASSPEGKVSENSSVSNPSSLLRTARGGKGQSSHVPFRSVGNLTRLPDMTFQEKPASHVHWLVTRRAS